MKSQFLGYNELHKGKGNEIADTKNIVLRGGSRIIGMVACISRGGFVVDSLLKFY